MSRTFNVELTHDQIEQFLQLSNMLKTTFEHVVPTEYKEKAELVKFFSKVKSYEDMCASNSNFHYSINNRAFNVYAEFFFRNCKVEDFVYVGPATNDIGTSFDAEIRSTDDKQVLVHCFAFFGSYLMKFAQENSCDYCMLEHKLGEIISNAVAAGISPENRIIFTPHPVKNVKFVRRSNNSMEGDEMIGAEQHVRVFAREEQLAILEKYPTFWEDLTADLIEKL